MEITLLPSEDARLNSARSTLSSKLFPIPGSTLMGFQRGWVLNCRNAENDLAIVIHESGFCQMARLRGTDDFVDQALRALLEVPLPPRFPHYLLLYCVDQSCTPINLPTAFRNTRSRKRIRWEWESATPHQNELQAEHDVRTGPLDRASIDHASLHGLINIERFWGSAEVFFQNAHACATWVGDRPVAICYAAATHMGLAEVDIVTEKEYRRRGFGTLATKAFVQKVRSAGLMPTWDCFVTNEASMLLAQHLGFEPRLEYDFITFELP